MASQIVQLQPGLVHRSTQSLVRHAANVPTSGTFVNVPVLSHISRTPLPPARQPLTFVLLLRRSRAAPGEPGPRRTTAAQMVSSRYSGVPSGVIPRSRESPSQFPDPRTRVLVPLRTQLLQLTGPVLGSVSPRGRSRAIRPVERAAAAPTLEATQVRRRGRAAFNEHVHQLSPSLPEVARTVRATLMALASQPTGHQMRLIARMIVDDHEAGKHRVSLALDRVYTDEAVTVAVKTFVTRRRWGQEPLTGGTRASLLRRSSRLFSKRRSRAKTQNADAHSQTDDALNSR